MTILARTSGNRTRQHSDATRMSADFLFQERRGDFRPLGAWTSGHASVRSFEKLRVILGASDDLIDHPAVDLG